MAAPAHSPSVINILDPTASHNEYDVHGYPRLAVLFSKSPLYLHVRRFSALSARLLLRRQHRIIALEQQLVELEKKKMNTFCSNKLYFSDFSCMKNEKDKDSVRLREVYEELDKEMKEYEDVLIRTNTLGSRSADKRKLRHVQDWLSQPDGINGDAPLTGIDALVWGTIRDPSSHKEDIIQVIEAPETSAFENFMNSRGLSVMAKLPRILLSIIFCSRQKPDEHSKLGRDSKRIGAMYGFLGNILSGLIIAGGILLLYSFKEGPSMVVIALAFALLIGVCASIFKNEHFIMMIAGVTAVHSALLKSNNKC
ncbi:hypothetical protein B0J11DRAFT_529598 [Dendryphion nanum]|uniref:DUF6594 domain-containing protein n=1 Tax=Dendryphion nanum TaxID=256645 RepID=A0A9P9DQY8_9PLEO|nr:hypothetical protein B0J11DRAFT_529598 [Dendryphion nanum]